MPSKKVTMRSSIANRPTCGGSKKAGLAPRSTNFMMGVKRNHHFVPGQPFKDDKESQQYVCVESGNIGSYFIPTPENIPKYFTGVDYIYTNNEKDIIFFFSNGRHKFGKNTYIKVPLNDLKNMNNYQHQIIDDVFGGYTWVSVQKDENYYYALFSGGVSHNTALTITHSKLYKFDFEMKIVETFTYTIPGKAARNCLLYDLGTLNEKSEEGVLNCIIVGENGVSIYNYNEPDNELFNTIPEGTNRYLGVLPYPSINPKYLIIGNREKTQTTLSRDVPNILLNLNTLELMDSLNFCDVSSVDISIISKQNLVESSPQQDSFDYIITGNSQSFLYIPDYTWKIIKNEQNDITDIEPAHGLIENMNRYGEPQDEHFINNTSTRTIFPFYIDTYEYPFLLVVCEGTQSFILIPEQIQEQTQEPNYKKIYKLPGTKSLRSRGGIVITDKNIIYIILAVYDSDIIYYTIPKEDLINNLEDL
jgi:hypothetical protein